MGAEPEFRAFVVASYDGLVRTARLLTGDRQQAEDLTQSALTRTFVKWRSLRDPLAAEAYTRTVLTRLAMRAGRRRWRGELPTATVPERTAHDDYAVVDQADAVRRALARLPLEQRAVVVLRYLNQLTEAETADVLGCAVGTVKSRTSRALAALRASGVPAESVEATDE